MNFISLFRLVKDFFVHFSPRRRRQFRLLVLLMIMTSFAEVLSIGAVLPFLGVLVAPEKVWEYSIVREAFGFIGVSSSDQLFLPLTLLFVVAVLLSGAMRLLLVYVTTKLSYSVGADISYEMYRRTLYQPYIVHVMRNTSEIISGVTRKVDIVIQGLLIPFFTLFSSFVIVSFVLVTLFSIDPLVSIAAFSGFGFIYALVVFFTRSRLSRNSVVVAENYTRVVKVLQEGLGGVRDVLINGDQEEYCKSYRGADIPLRTAQASSIFIGASPRYAAEASGMAFIAILAYFVVQQSDGIESAIATLGVLALGAQRLLPVLQQIYVSLVSIKSSEASLHDVLDLLAQPLHIPSENRLQELSFNESLELKDISFRYLKDGGWVVQDLNFVIPKGGRIGFIGATGSGKSTLLDLIMGLLTPEEGAVLIDGERLTQDSQRSWQRRIAHVPQAVFLSDSSIRENIAFGVPEESIDDERVVRAARLAHLAEHIESLPDGYQTMVGERGVKLSGGQRQRIGIARALYRDADVIVFDEATSALDNETESSVMKSIEGLGKELTILIIAHRLSTLKGCDFIVELEGGKILRSGSFDVIVNNLQE